MKKKIKTLVLELPSGDPDTFMGVFSEAITAHYGVSIIDEAIAKIVEENVGLIIISMPDPNRTYQHIIMSSSFMQIGLEGESAEIEFGYYDRDLPSEEQQMYLRQFSY